MQSRNTWGAFFTHRFYVRARARNLPTNTFVLAPGGNALALPARDNASGSRPTERLQHYRTHARKKKS